MDEPQSFPSAVEQHEQQPVVVAIQPANPPLMGVGEGQPPPSLPADTLPGMPMTQLPPEANGDDYSANQNGIMPPAPVGRMLITDNNNITSDGTTDRLATAVSTNIDNDGTDELTTASPISGSVGADGLTVASTTIGSDGTDGLTMAPTTIGSDGTDGLTVAPTTIDSDGTDGLTMASTMPPMLAAPPTAAGGDGHPNDLHGQAPFSPVAGGQTNAEMVVDFVAQNATSSALDNNAFTVTTMNLPLVNDSIAGDGNWTTATTRAASAMSIEEDNEYKNYVKIDHSNLMWAKQYETNQNMETAWSGFFLGAAIANVLILVVLLIFTRGKRGYFGARLYTMNLAIFAIVQILMLAWAQPNDCFGLAKIASFSARKFFDKYNAQIMEWSQIVYLSCTTVLILDSIQRYRGNGAGIGKLRWILAIFILDAIPTVYIFVKGILFEFVDIRPKPLAVYHAVALAVFAICATLLKLVICCVPIMRLGCTRAPGEAAVAADRARVHALREKMMSNRSPTPKPFTLSKLALLMLFVMLTGWTQYTVFSLSMDLHPGGRDNKHEFERMSKHEGVHKMLTFVNKEHLTHTVMSIQQWAALLRPFLETLCALLLLLIPSIGRKFQMRKIAPGQNANNTGNSTNGNGTVNNDQRIAAGNFSRPMTASGRFVATAPPMAAIQM